MIETETVKQLAAGGLILATGTVCFVAAVRDPAMRTEHSRRERHAGAGSGSQSVAAATGSTAFVTTIAEDASIAKLRILTGEPGTVEQRRPAPRRALKLVLGIGALAAGGALGLLVLVKALISLFRQIGA